MGGEGLRIEGLVPVEYLGNGLGHDQADPSQVEHGQVSLLCSIAHSADHLDQSLFTAACSSLITTFSLDHIIA